MACSPDDPVRIGTAWSAEEAATIIAALRRAGIEGRAAQPSMPIDCLSGTLSVFEILVRRADLQAALQLLEEGDPIWSERCGRCGYSLVGLKAPATCPECGWDAAEHGTLSAQASATSDLARAGSRRLPWLTGWWLIVLGSAVAAIGVTILVTGPHSIEFYFAGGSAFNEHWPRGGPMTPSGYNIGPIALISLGFVLTVLGVRELRCRQRRSLARERVE